MQVEKRIHNLEEITLMYVSVDGVMSFVVVPTVLADKVTDDKFDMQYIRKNGFTHLRNKPMVQVALLGDNGEKEFFAGNCMQNSSSCYEFKFVSQEVVKDEKLTEVITFFDNGKGQVFEHHVKKVSGVNAVECYNKLINNGDEITVEMISSVSIDCISPFCAENDVDNLFVYRMRTSWSAEGKLEKFSAADMQMEDPWSSYGIRLNRISSIGSMPCRTYMPFYAIEDKNANCTWAVSIEAPMSWQLDALHHQTSISITGGIADFENGHFRKKLAKGESFTTYSGFVTAVNGGIERACADLQQEYAARLNVPELEEDLPIIYNEYCCSWGNPSIGNLKPMIDECSKLGVKEFVVDVGWWRPDERSWYSFGDWNPSPILFPNGISELSNYIRSKGMIPGIWFEFEGVSTDSLLFGAHKDFMLTRDGGIITHRERTLLDFRKPEVKEYVTEKVIKLLKDNNFGYVKIDYNEPVGIGVDGAESYGEGLRQHMEEVIGFYGEIKKAIPEIVIEVCSSGGHRLEPKFLSLASMASFSDAHEGVEGAVIACDLHRYMLPRQMQIWATLNEGYTTARIYFTLIKGMLGRLALSGDLLKLTGEKRVALERAIPFYNSIKGIVKDGETLINENNGITSLRQLHGERFIVRFSKDKSVAVVWAFSYNKGNSFTVNCNEIKGYTLQDEFCYGKLKQTDNGLVFEQKEESDVMSFACVLKRN